MMRTRLVQGERASAEKQRRSWKRVSGLVALAFVTGTVVAPVGDVLAATAAGAVTTTPTVPDPVVTASNATTTTPTTSAPKRRSRSTTSTTAAPAPAAAPTANVSPAAQPAANAANTGGTTTLILKLKHGLSRKNQQAIVQGGGGIEKASVPALDIEIVTVPAGKAGQATKSYKSKKNVSRVEQSATRTAASVPSDPAYG